MAFGKIKDQKSIFPQKKFYYFLTKLKAELWLMPGTWFLCFFSSKIPSIYFFRNFSPFFLLVTCRIIAIFLFISEKMISFANYIIELK